jgi:hypothetical protein
VNKYIHCHNQTARCVRKTNSKAVNPTVDLALTVDRRTGGLGYSDRSGSSQCSLRCSLASGNQPGRPACVVSQARQAIEGTRRGITRPRDTALGLHPSRDSLAHTYTAVVPSSRQVFGGSRRAEDLRWTSTMQCRACAVSSRGEQLGGIVASKERARQAVGYSGSGGGDCHGLSGRSRVTEQDDDLVDRQA